ncbi:MAG: endonuclease MutS2, partial [Myxococcota bacterium]
MLSGLELLSCARLIQTGARVRAFYKTHTLLAPRVAAVAEKVPRLNPIASRISDMIEPSGALKDSASDALAEYRGRARSLHQQIQGRIKGMLDDPDFGEVLRDDYFSVRNDRYVLPIISSFRGRVPGIVHNASGTGQTIFVEPDQIIGLGNELSIAQSLVAEEEERLYAELSTDLADYADELDETLERLGRIDLLEACARLSDELDATRPEIAENGAFVLPEARHPVLILQGKTVVPNRIELAPEQRALVVSGPNAGGKTVTITSLGLAALFLRAGLPVAGGSGCRVPLTKGVGSVIGDAQDMSRDLSTFTAHLSRLGEILEHVGGGWLVLIDEIAADTDPTEGAAIAVAVLERLVEKHGQVAV